VKISGIRIQNFLAIGTASVDLAGRGLRLIQGVNDDETSADSNGAGKSSIADAICWCLYGKTARGEDTDKVVNKTAGKDTVVDTWIVDDDGWVHIVSRYRKHSSMKNALRVVQVNPATLAELELTKGTNDLTQKLVEQIMGCSYEVFTGAIYMAQENAPDLPGMTDKQLKLLIEEASGATLLEAAYVEANKRLTAACAVQSHTENELHNTGVDLTTAEKRIADLEDKRKLFEEERTVRMRAIGREAIVAKTRRDELDAKLAGSLDEVNLRAGIKLKDDTIAAVAKERREEARLNAAVEDARRGVAKHRERVSHLDAEAKRREKAAIDLSHKAGCPCPSCDRPFTEEDIKPARKIAEKAFADALLALTNARDDLGVAETRAVERTDERERFRVTMTDLTRTNAERASLERQLDELLALKKEREVIGTKLAGYVRDINSKKLEPNPYTALGETEEKRRGEILASVATLGVKRADAETAVELARQVVKVFSPSGVRAYLLDEVTPFLNDQTAKYLGILSDGNISAKWTTLTKSAKGDLKEKFSIEVTTVTGGESFRSISGGEKRKVRLACALALQDLVARRATKPIELLILDEIDNALDNAGLERLMTLLEEKAREKGSIFLISHSDLKEWCRDVMTVKKIGGLATIEDSVS
jgi:DNA repair exonuclease SbcCD ATPase subunit